MAPPRRPSSLNLAQRRRERERIEAENRALVARLQTAKATYDASKFAKDARERERWLASATPMPRPLAASRPVSAEMLASGGGGGSGLGGVLWVGRVGRPDGRRDGGRRRARGGGLKPLKRPARAARAAAPRRRASAESVLSVLDLLSSHMRGASASLGEMRIARDSLMEGIYPVLEHYHVNIVDCGGVKWSSSRAAPRAQALHRRRAAPRSSCSSTAACS